MADQLGRSFDAAPVPDAGRSRGFEGVRDCETKYCCTGSLRFGEWAGLRSEGAIVLDSNKPAIPRRDGRVAEGARLESVYPARYPGFESLSLRHTLLSLPLQLLPDHKFF